MKSKGVVVIEEHVSMMLTGGCEHDGDPNTSCDTRGPGGSCTREGGSNQQAYGPCPGNGLPVNDQSGKWTGGCMPGPRSFEVKLSSTGKKKKLF